MNAIQVVKIGKRKWRLLEDFNFNLGESTKVPKGFETNGASVPRLFWWFLDPATELFEAATVHDYLLSINSNKADIIFYRLALKYGVPSYKAKIAYLSVKLYSVFTKTFVGKKYDFR